MFFINPFIYGAGADFESIATVTVGSGGASSIEFTSIPGTYQHLQVRMIGRSTASANSSYALLRLNSDAGTSYAWHHLRADGANAAAAGSGNGTEGYVEEFTGNSASASVFGAAVVDLLDYSSTTKNKTVRSFAGNDRNGAGRLYLYSNLWMSTAAVTAISLIVNSGNWAQHTTAALYGIKAP